MEWQVQAVQVSGGARGEVWGRAHPGQKEQQRQRQRGRSTQPVRSSACFSKLIRPPLLTHPLPFLGPQRHRTPHRGLSFPPGAPHRCVDVGGEWIGIRTLRRLGAPRGLACNIRCESQASTASYTPCRQTQPRKTTKCQQQLLTGKTERGQTSEGPYNCVTGALTVRTLTHIPAQLKNKPTVLSSY